MFIFLLITTAVVAIIWLKTRLTNYVPLQSFGICFGGLVAFEGFIVIMAILGHSQKLWTNWQTYASLVLVAMTLAAVIYATYLRLSKNQVCHRTAKAYHLEPFGQTSNGGIYLIHENNTVKFVRNGQTQWVKPNLVSVNVYDDNSQTSMVRVITHQRSKKIAGKDIITGKSEKYIFHLPDGAYLHLRGARKGAR